MNSNSTPTYQQLATNLVRQRLEYYGHSEEWINRWLYATHNPNESGCESIEPGIYQCENENGQSLHPELDTITETVEWVTWLMDTLFTDENTVSISDPQTDNDFDVDLWDWDFKYRMVKAYPTISKIVIDCYQPPSLEKLNEGFRRIYRSQNLQAICDDYLVEQVTKALT